MFKFIQKFILVLLLLLGVFSSNLNAFGQTAPTVPLTSKTLNSFLGSKQDFNGDGSGLHVTVNGVTQTLSSWLLSGGGTSSSSSLVTAAGTTNTQTLAVWTSYLTGTSIPNPISLGGTLTVSGTVSGAGITSLLLPYLLTTTANSTYQPLLGFTPYNSTNPAGYQTSANVTSAINSALTPYLLSTTASTTYQPLLGFTPYNSTNPSGYQTAANVTSSLAPYAPLSSPVFTGVPTGPTPITTDNSKALATTEYVTAKVASVTAGVSTVLGNSGAVTLSEMVTGGLAPIDSPTFTGTINGAGMNLTGTQTIGGSGYGSVTITPSSNTTAATSGQSQITNTLSPGGNGGSGTASLELNKLILYGAPTNNWWNGLDILQWSGSGGNGQHVARYAQTTRYNYATGGASNNPQLWGMVSENDDFTGQPSSNTNAQLSMEFDLTGHNVDNANNRQNLAVIIRPAADNANYFEASNGVAVTMNTGGYVKRAFSVGGAYTLSALDLRYARTYEPNSISLSTSAGTYPTVTSAVTASTTIPVSNVLPFTSDYIGRDINTGYTNTIYFSDGKTATETAYTITGSGSAPAGTITISAPITEASGNTIGNNSRAIWLGSGMHIALDTNGTANLYGDGTNAIFTSLVKTQGLNNTGVMTLSAPDGSASSSLIYADNLSNLYHNDFVVRTGTSTAYKYTIFDQSGNLIIPGVANSTGLNLSASDNSTSASSIYTDIATTRANDIVFRTGISTAYAYTYIDASGNIVIPGTATLGNNLSITNSTGPAQIGLTGSGTNARLYYVASNSDGTFSIYDSSSASERLSISSVGDVTVGQGSLWLPNNKSLYGNSLALAETVTATGSSNAWFAFDSGFAGVHIGNTTAPIDLRGSVTTGGLTTNGDYSITGSIYLNAPDGKGGSGALIYSDDSVNNPYDLVIVTGAPGSTKTTYIDQVGSLHVSANIITPGLITGNTLTANSTQNITQQGAYMQWDRAGSDGGTWLVNQKGLGAGGFNFGEVTTSNVFTKTFGIDPSGNITATGTITATNIGSAASKTASSSTAANLASVSATPTTGHIAIFNDTNGTIYDAGASPISHSAISDWTTATSGFFLSSSIPNSSLVGGTGSALTSISIGSGLSLSGGVLSATGSGSGGTVTSTNGMIASGFTTGSFNLVLPSSNYGVGLRNDNTDFYMLLTNNTTTPTTDSWNNLRPFAIHLATGQVTMQNGLIVNNVDIPKNTQTVANVIGFGADPSGRTDSTPAFNAAITSLYGGGIVYVPPGLYLITNLNIAQQGIQIQCASNESTNLSQNSTSGDFITFTGGRNQIVNCGLMPSVRTSGFQLVFYGPNCLSCASINNTIQYAYNGINVSSSSGSVIDNTTINNIFGPVGVNFIGTAALSSYQLLIRNMIGDNNYPVAPGSVIAWSAGKYVLASQIVNTNGGIYQVTTNCTTGSSAPSGLPPGTDGASVFSATITDGTCAWRFVSNAYHAWVINDSYAYSLSLIDSNLIAGGVGLYVTDTANTGSSYPKFGRINNLGTDHSFNNDIDFASGFDFNMVNSWNGSSLTGNGITFESGYKGSSVISGARIVGNWYIGILINGGNDITITGNNIQSNSISSQGNTPNIAVAGGVSRFNITNNHVGADMDVGNNPNDNYGIVVNGGSSDYYVITGNICAGKTTTGICVSDSGTGGSKNVSGNY